MLKLLLLWFSANPTHMASSGYVFPRRAVILVMEKAAWHSVCSSCRWNDQSIGFPAKGYTQCGSRHQPYQIHITTLSCWWGMQFLAVSWRWCLRGAWSLQMTFKLCDLWPFSWYFRRRAQQNRPSLSKEALQNWWNRRYLRGTCAWWIRRGTRGSEGCESHFVD